MAYIVADGWMIIWRPTPWQDFSASLRDLMIMDPDHEPVGENERALGMEGEFAPTVLPHAFLLSIVSPSFIPFGHIVSL